ncbi:unnamed protein product [Aphanomyces euteiches]
MTASETTGAFKNKRNQTLYYQRHFPKTEVALGLVVFLHGLGEYSARYKELLEFLRDAKWVVYAYDFVGHGQSEGEQMYFDRFENLVEDTGVFMEFARSDMNSTFQGSIADKCILIGNSLGGLSYSRSACVPQTLALSIQSVIVSILSATFPQWRIIPGGDRNNLTSDQTILDAMDDDPYLNKLPTSCRVAQELLDAFSSTSLRRQDVHVPVLVLLGSDEKMVSTASIRDYVDGIASQDKKLLVLDGFGHLMLLKPDRQQVFDAVAVWLDRH